MSFFIVLVVLWSLLLIGMFILIRVLVVVMIYFKKYRVSNVYVIYILRGIIYVEYNLFFNYYLC